MDILDNLKQLISSEKKDHYIISFTKEDNYWYCDIPNWPGSHEQTMMVAGSDRLLDAYNNGSNHVTIELYIGEEPHKDYTKLVQTHSELLGGADYDVIDSPNLPDKIWICPVTLFVLGRYPKTMWIRNISK